MSEDGERHLLGAGDPRMVIEHLVAGDNVRPEVAGDEVLPTQSEVQEYIQIFGYNPFESQCE